MANSTYEIMWRDAMGDLDEQLNVEGVEEEEELSHHPGQNDGHKSSVSNTRVILSVILVCHK